MINTEKLESYMINLDLTFEEVGENTWIINDTEKGLEQIIVMVEDPLVIMRVKVMERPNDSKEAFYEELLNLNASDLVHGAYALDGDDVILLNTLQSETMDLEEFQASLDALGLALAQHYPILSKYRK